MDGQLFLLLGFACPKSTVLIYGTMGEMWGIYYFEEAFVILKNLGYRNSEIIGNKRVR